MKSMILYLASRSPRRKELLSQAGIRFRVYIPREEELAAPRKTATPPAIVRKISRAKAQSALLELRAQGEKAGLILSADTLVFYRGKVLGKPDSKRQAEQMLKQLSGQWHQVCTAVTCVKFAGEKITQKTICVSSRVKFFPLSKPLLSWYIATGEPMDKAGAYGAQTFGASLIEKFSGSYTNVVGLPVGETLRLLEEVSGWKRAQLIGKNALLKK
jgi:septum formation protein